MYGKCYCCTGGIIAASQYDQQHVAIVTLYGRTISSNSNDASVAKNIWMCTQCMELMKPFTVRMSDQLCTNTAVVFECTYVYYWYNDLLYEHHAMQLRAYALYLSA
jgi:hypothetical protein